MSEVVIRFQNVAKSFGHKTVLKDVTFEVRSGEVFGIIGMSGSGKTTLLNTLIGFLQPDYGDIRFRLEHLLEFEEDEETQYRSVFKNLDDVKRTFGFAAQTPSFYENLTPVENLEYFGRMYGLSKDVRKTNADILLHLMRLQSSKNVLAKNLSGGMQKRLDIACALIHDPKVLILDEPTADLDPLLRREMWELIKKINNKGTTILMASHFLDEIESLCDRVGILFDGVILKSGTPDELKNVYTHDEEIHIQTSPGRYDLLINYLKAQQKKLNITRIINKGHKLVIYTLSAEKVLHFLLHGIEKLDESLLDVYVNKPSLEEAFESLIKESRKKKD
ncbi:ABC transporter ATP-binding protein [Candidatus Woesearchaeota archaeon]|nr:MAG: ABC transporter ATP-binding protein [Candidatus Woesearchaeota archaeon]